MLITEKMVVDRMALLTVEKERAVATLNALLGAIQDCEFWQKELEKEEPAESTKGNKIGLPG